MNDTIIYYPYRSHKWFLFVTIPVGMLSFVLVGYGLPYWRLGVFFFGATGIACVWLTKTLYDSSNIAIFFEREGLRIVGRIHKDYRYVLWEQLSYVCYVKNFKGHLFFVLSSRALEDKETKRIVNRAAIFSKICVDDAIVVHMDVIQNTSSVKEVIDKYILAQK